MLSVCVHMWAVPVQRTQGLEGGVHSRPRCPCQTPSAQTQGGTLRVSGAVGPPGLGRRSLVSRPGLCPSWIAGCPQWLPQPHTVSAQLAPLWTAACAGRTGPVSWALGAGAMAESTHGPWGPAAPAHPAHMWRLFLGTHTWGRDPVPRACMSSERNST